MWARLQNPTAEASIDCGRLEPRLQNSTSALPFHTWTAPNGTVWAYFFRQGPNYLVRFPNLADFQITSDGREVRCRPVPDVSDETIQHLYLNQIMPLALSKQGKLVLHGSAVEITDKAVVFVGQSGAGKSTLATSFGTSGYRVMSDDGLLIAVEEQEYWVQPSHPSVRLWEDSQQAIIGQSARLAPPVQYTSKARVLADGFVAFCDQPRPVKCIYLLGNSPTHSTQIQTVTARKALVELVKHSFLLDIEAPEMLAGHFDQLSDLVAKLACYRLDYPRHYDALKAVRRAILEHVNHRAKHHETV